MHGMSLRVLSIVYIILCLGWENFKFNTLDHDGLNDDDMPTTHIHVQMLIHNIVCTVVDEINDPDN